MDVLVTDSLPADPLGALRELARGEVELDRLRLDRVQAAREQGVSWEAIGAALGMSKQSAWEYFTRRARSELAEGAASNAELSDEEAEAFEALTVEEVRRVRRRRASNG